MDKVFWLIRDQLAGREGPDMAPWDLAALRAGGIGAVLSVNDGALCDPDDFTGHDIVYARVSLSDNAPPQPGDDAHCINALPRAYEFARTQIGEGRGVLVHCSAGKDRTGLFLSYFLMRHDGASAEQAMASVRRVRPIAFSALGWEAFAAEVLRRFE